MTERRPVSDHCDGQHFFNPGPSRGAASLMEVLRWRLGGGRAVWPAAVADPAFPQPPDAVPAGTAAVTFVNHSTFLFRVAGLVILTDPIFSARCSPVGWAGPKRVRPPGLPLARLPASDIILLSHNHYDHLDLPSLQALHRRHAPRVVTTPGTARTLRGAGITAEELDWWESVTIGAATITATPARHFAARTPFDRNRALWAGFMVAAGGGQMLFAGDSATGPHWGEIGARLGPPNLALLPIGAYEPRRLMSGVHMNPAEAVQAHRDLGARQSVGMHFGTFQLTDEAIDAPEAALRAALAAAHVPQASFTTHGFGETRLYPVG